MKCAVSPEVFLANVGEKDITPVIIISAIFCMDVSFAVGMAYCASVGFR